MRRSEEARVSEEAVRRKSGGGSPRNWEWARERPRSPCEVRKNPRRVGRAKGEVRKPKCQRKED